MGVWGFMCFRVCRVTWFGCSKPIAWPRSRRRVCVCECMWKWTALFARLFLFPPKGGRGRPWWMRSSCHICKHTHLHKMHKHAHLLSNSIWLWASDGKLESVKVSKVWTVTSNTAGYCHCLNFYTVITAGRLTLVINLLHQVHFIISLSLTDRWDGPSSKWQSNWYKVIPFKDYSVNGS